MHDPEVRLEHAFLTVRDVDRSLHFYRRLFPGWDIRWQGLSDDGHRWIHIGPPGTGRPSYLSLNEDPQAADPDAAYTSTRIQHIGFAHPDVHGLLARLAPLGIGSAGPVIDDGKFRRAYIFDPDGHELEFVQGLGQG